MKHLRVGDILILLLAIFSLIFFYKGKNGEKTSFVIEANGKLYRYTLDKDMVIEVYGKRGKAVVEITNGNVRFVDSECPDKICVRDGYLKNKPIICLPNNVIVMYPDDRKKDDICDAVSH